MKKRIWFNKSFNTTYHIINLVKNNSEGIDFEIFGTNPNPYSAMLQACDHFEVEPKITDEKEYIDYALDFCKRNKIDIFMPGYYFLSSISRHKKLFENINTKVLVSDNYELIEIFNSKIDTYNSIKNFHLVEIPQYYMVNSVDEFKLACEKLYSTGHRVCFKPAVAQGGAGFRIISDTSTNKLKNLLGDLSYKVDFDDVCKILSSADSFNELIVMEYIDGYEYSIDCLGYEGKLLFAVPRKKIDGRVRYLEENEELIELAKKVTEIYNMSHIYNIQVRYSTKDKVFKLLEINPRISGGMQISALSGVNFPYFAIKLLLGQDVETFKPKLDLMFTQIESEIYLEYKEINSLVKA